MKITNILFTAFLVFACLSLYSVSGVIIALAALVCWTVIKIKEDTAIEWDFRKARNKYEEAYELLTESKESIAKHSGQQKQENQELITRLASLELQLQNMKVGQSLKMNGGR